jgi:hypothetical protein
MVAFMVIHSLTIIHYGVDYLSYALRSVYDYVDELHIFYTPTPSHGHITNLPPIETKEELQRAAFAYDPDKKVRWYTMLNVKYEGEQRDLALLTVVNAGAELVLVLDCDEVWPENTLYNTLQLAENGNCRDNLVNMIHLWGSFNWACRDDGWPVRIINLMREDGICYLPREAGPVYHFGYAVTHKVMRYKWNIHGHKNELRPEWFNEHWNVWPPTDNSHPTNGRNERGEAFWTPEPFDKSQLSELMKDHPFYGLERIE